MNSHRNAIYDDFLGVFTGPQLNSKKLEIRPNQQFGVLDDEMINSYIKEIFEEDEESGTESDYNPNSKKSRLNQQKKLEKRQAQAQNYQKMQTYQKSNVEKTTLQEAERVITYDKDIFKQMINSLDPEILKSKQIMALRNDSKKKFGFYDKLCLVTERVKLFNELFNRDPKFIRQRSQKKPAIPVLSPYKTLKANKRKTFNSPDFLNTLNFGGRGNIKAKLSTHLRTKLVVPTGSKNNIGSESTMNVCQRKSRRESLQMNPASRSSSNSQISPKNNRINPPHYPGEKSAASSKPYMRKKVSHS